MYLVYQEFSQERFGIFVGISEKIQFVSSGVGMVASQSCLSVSLCVLVVELSPLKSTF